MVSIEEISREHAQILGIIEGLEKLIPLGKSIDVILLKNTLKKFEKLWKKHERKEDLLFSRLNLNNFDNEKMFLDEHKQLKGHWKVMNLAISKKNKEVWVALDTDGRMLFNKFREHIHKEEYFLQNISF